MNFLTLCQTTASKCSIPGSMSSVVSQTGEFGLVVGWVNEAWNDLQQMERWDWLKDDFTFQTVADTHTYTPTQAGAADMAAWDDESVRCYLTSSGVASERFLDFVRYKDLRDVHQFQTQVSSEPIVFAQLPEDGSIVLGPRPNGIYTVYGKYWKSPTQMAANADLPTGLPSKFHWLIVYRAMRKYAEYEGSASVDVAAARSWAPLYAQMLVECLPEMEVG